VTRENRKLIRGLPKKSLRERVKIDIRLHNRTIKGCYYGAKKCMEYYLDANAVKYVLLDILDGKITDLRRIRRTIVKLKRDRRTHLWNRAGPRDWDKAWVRIYDEWIDCLQDKLS